MIILSGRRKAIEEYSIIYLCLCSSYILPFNWRIHEPFPAFCIVIFSSLKYYAQFTFPALLACLNILVGQGGQSLPVFLAYKVFTNQLTTHGHGIRACGQESATGIQVHATGWYQF